MNRRELIILLGGAAIGSPLAARAQQPPGIPRIGLLMGATPATEAPKLGVFREALKGLGYIDGQTIAIEPRYGESQPDRLPMLARELVALAPAVLAGTERSRIVDFAVAHRLPTIWEVKPNAAAGGLLSYGPDTIENTRLAAGYVDKILKGAKPADLPVQQPVKFELVINLKTAKALGLTVPPALLARADEVIE